MPNSNIVITTRGPAGRFLQIISANDIENLELRVVAERWFGDHGNAKAKDIATTWLDGVRGLDVAAQANLIACEIITFRNLFKDLLDAPIVEVFLAPWQADWTSNVLAPTIIFTWVLAIGTSSLQGVRFPTSIAAGSTFLVTVSLVRCFKSFEASKPHGTFLSLLALMFACYIKQEEISKVFTIGK